MGYFVSNIIFHKLSYLDKANEAGLYPVVRWETDSTLYVEKDAIEAIKLLSEGKTVQETADSLSYSFKTMSHFITIMQDAGFIKQIDKTIIPDLAKHIKPMLVHTNRKYFKWFIYKPFLLVSFLFIILGIIIALFHPQYFPSYHNFFWTSDLFVVFISIILIDTLLLILHECGHLIATKAVGGEAKIKLFDFRYLYLVSETESYHLAFVPKLGRFFIYWAGMFIDLFVVSSIFCFFATAELFHMHIGILKDLLLVTVLLKIMGIIWQYNVFLETDMFNFLSDYFGQQNIRENTKKTLVFFVIRLIKNSPINLNGIVSKLVRYEKQAIIADDLRELHKSEKYQIKLYAFILVFGLALTTAQFLLLTLPRDFTFLTYSIHSLVQGIQKNDTIIIVKSCLLFIFLTYQYVILLFLFFRKRRAAVT